MIYIITYDPYLNDWPSRPIIWEAAFFTSKEAAEEQLAILEKAQPEHGFEIEELTWFDTKGRELQHG